MNKNFDTISPVNWNIIEGCEKVSAGCKNCYAETTLGDEFRNVKINRELIHHPPKWKDKSKTITLAENGDWLHEKMPTNLIHDVIKHIRRETNFTFSSLTKRVERIPSIFDGIVCPRNMYVGVSVEDQETADYRIPFLNHVKGGLRNVSIQPLLGPIILPNVHIDYVIVGQEWGPVYRDMDIEWVKDIKRQCTERNIKMIFQQKMDHGMRVMYPRLEEV